MSSQPNPPKLKLIVRRLPPALPEAIFWKSVEPWCGIYPVPESKDTPELDSHESAKDKCLWRRWVQGKKVDENNQFPVYSRAYVLLPTSEAIVAFHQAYDGHVFRSKDGQEFQAVVEFAPSQKLPPAAAAALAAHSQPDKDKEKKKGGKGGKNRVDARQGQIDEDPDYLSFLKSMEEPVEKMKMEDNSVNPPNTTSTPLLDHLREMRLAKKGHLASTSNNSKKAAHSSPGDDYKREVIYSTDGRVSAHQEGAPSQGNERGKKGKGMASASAWSGEGAEGGSGGGKGGRQGGQGKAGGGGGKSKNPESGQPRNQGPQHQKSKPPQTAKPASHASPGPSAPISLLQRPVSTAPTPPPSASSPQGRQQQQPQAQRKPAPRGGFQGSAALLRGALNASTASTRPANPGGPGQGGVQVQGGGQPEGGSPVGEGEKKKRVRVKKKPAGGGGAGAGAGAGVGGDAGSAGAARIDD